MSIESIRKRLEATTSGEWTIDVCGKEYGVNPIARIYETIDQASEMFGILFPLEKDDAEFIVHSKRDIEALLKVVEAVKAAFDYGTATEFKPDRDSITDMLLKVDSLLDELEAME